MDGDGLPDIIAHVELPDESETQFAYLQRPKGWPSAPSFVLSTLRATSAHPFVFIGNIDGKYGADVTSVNDTATLSSDQQNKFGNVFLSDGQQFIAQASFAPPVQFSRTDKQERGVRLLDLHGRGLPDIIFRRDVTQDGNPDGIAATTRLLSVPDLKVLWPAWI